MGICVVVRGHAVFCSQRVQVRQVFCVSDYLFVVLVLLDDHEHVFETNHLSRDENCWNLGNHSSHPGAGYPTGGEQKNYQPHSHTRLAYSQVVGRPTIFAPTALAPNPPSVFMKAQRKPARSVSCKSRETWQRLQSLQGCATPQARSPIPSHARSDCSSPRSQPPAPLLESPAHSRCRSNPQYWPSGRTLYPAHLDWLPGQPLPATAWTHTPGRSRGTDCPRKRGWRPEPNDG